MKRESEMVPSCSADASHFDTLVAVLDTLVPASSDGRLPAAGSIGLGPEICEQLAKTPPLWAMVREGLQQLEELCRSQHGVSFRAAPEDQRAALLNSQPFLLPLLMHTLVIYYRHPAVLAGIGLAPRPPHPEGYRFDET